MERVGTKTETNIPTWCFIQQNYHTTGISLASERTHATVEVHLHVFGGFPCLTPIQLETLSGDNFI